MERKRPEDHRLAWSAAGGLVLYRDELEAIFAELSAVGVHVDADTADFKGITSVDELATIKFADDDVVRLRATAENGTEVASVEIRFKTEFLKGPAGATVTTSTDDLTMVGFLTKVQEIIQPRRRWLPPSRLMWVLGGGFYVLWGTSYAAQGDTAKSLLLLGGYLLGSGWAALALVKRLRRTVRIDFRRRADAPSFAARNRDEIVIAVVTTAVGTGLGFLLGRLTS